MSSLVLPVELPKRLKKTKSYEESMLMDSNLYKNEVFAKCRPIERKDATDLESKLEPIKDADYEGHLPDTVHYVKENLQKLLVKTGMNEKYIVGDFISYQEEGDQWKPHVILKRLDDVRYPPVQRRYSY